MTNIKVAIIDDEKLFIAGLKMILEECGFDIVYTAYDGSQLKKEVLDNGLPGDIILLDLSMPVLDGIDTLNFLIEYDASAKVIILSSHYNDSIIIRLLDSGASGFLPKNANPEEVISTIQGVHKNGFHINNEILQLIRSRKLFAKRSTRKDLDLTSREKEVLKLICKEFTNKEIADLLHISPRTVEGHRNHILDKTESKNTAGIVIYAIENKLIEVNIPDFGS